MAAVEPQGPARSLVCRRGNVALTIPEDQPYVASGAAFERRDFDGRRQSGASNSLDTAGKTLSSLSTGDLRKLPQDKRKEYMKVVFKATSLLKPGGLLVPKDSLYGSVVVLPQIANCLGMHSFYVAKAIVAFIALFIVLIMQFLFVYEVFKMVELHDVGCQNDQDMCHDRGFKPGGWSWFGEDRQVWFLCSPQDSGDTSMSMLRKLCIIAYVTVLFKDLRQTFEMLMLLWHVPNAIGTWMVVTTREEKRIEVTTENKKRVVAELDTSMTWQVDALEVKWKIIYFVTVIVPKGLIFCLLLWYGSIWLMNESQREVLIVNAVSLVFVLELDEAVFAAVTPADVQQYMDNLQPWNPEVEDEEVGDSDSDEDLQHLGEQGGLGYTLAVVASVMTFPALLGIIVGYMVFWFQAHCNGVL